MIGGIAYKSELFKMNRRHPPGRRRKRGVRSKNVASGFGNNVELDIVVKAVDNLDRKITVL